MTPSGIEPATFWLVAQCPLYSKLDTNMFQVLWEVRKATKDMTVTTTNECREETALRRDAKRIAAAGAKAGGGTSHPSPSFCSLPGVMYKLYAYI
jgi:hypothetical protein